ncbi:sugar fermentation stimulation protein A [Marininema mesophilum]|uniref:Sugar fermentation stimulation protein homolog n=1 Tax=Marininema mesophilum TaxID=1048340 RepID=A0A1H3C1W2_9BACL|nr:DNA/RNA nuclease SfsA [Marininema mesophilum]SDX48051.1 sugar fermentation stimulation protein A [Marininema mesophilum]
MAVSLPGEVVQGIFLERPNRFQAVVEIQGIREIVHVPNTGRMSGLLAPGIEVALVRSDNPKRKHPYSLTLVKKKGTWVCVYSALANRVFEDGIQGGRVRGIQGEVRREVKFGASRMDFYMEGEPPTLIEVKCVTYEENGVAMFPDAPTQRGQKHVGELIQAVEEGMGGMIAFVAFMDYVNHFTPYDRIDPVLGEQLRKADSVGIDLRAYVCSINFDGIKLEQEIPVLL